MNCYDILVNRRLNHYEIVSGLSEMFSVKTSEIFVIDEIEAETLIKEDIRVLCQIETVNGDFCQLLSIFKDGSLKNISFQKAVGNFCRLLNCICLISDNEINPYSMVMVTDKGDYKTVFLSHSHLEQGKYTIKCVESLPEPEPTGD